MFPQGTTCCGKASKTKGYDCVMVPGASAKPNGAVQAPSICGRKFVTTADLRTPASICCE